MSADARPLRGLVVDDSALAREALARILPAAGVEVVGTASDGEEALREALRLEPDLVLLDLEMPRMDGLTFLRLLMARRPTPVIVVSARSARVDAFKALELGAIEYVSKPDAGPLEAIRDELAGKVRVVRALRRSAPPAPGRGAAPRALSEPPRAAVVGASTGGPQALLRLLSALPGDLPLAICIAQHMPGRFTATFAERLARRTPFSVSEAADGDVVAVGRVLVAPGGCHLALRRDEAGVLRAAVQRGDGDPQRYCPSVDVLFASAAEALGPRACAVVLTGMGQDGGAGVAAVKRAGGLTIAESEESAVVFGMPKSAAEGGAVDEMLALDAIAARLVRFARGS